MAKLTIYTDPKTGKEYRTYYFSPIDKSPGELAGNSRKWGDAPADVKEAVVNMIINEGRKAGLSDRDIAILLAIAYIDSGFNPDAAARTTTASGVWIIY
jgi:putative chitinase